MKVWVMQGSYEGEMFCSTHLTEKGAAIAAIGDLLDFLGVDDEETALSHMNERYHAEEQTEAIEWDREKMKDMKRPELWEIFSAWSEISWDRMADRGYNLDVSATEIQA